MEGRHTLKVLKRQNNIAITKEEWTTIQTKLTEHCVKQCLAGVTVEDYEHNGFFYDKATRTGRIFCTSSRSASWWKIATVEATKGNAIAISEEEDTVRFSLSAQSGYLTDQNIIKSVMRANWSRSQDEIVPNFISRKVDEDDVLHITASIPKKLAKELRDKSVNGQLHWPGGLVTLNWCGGEDRIKDLNVETTGSIKTEEIKQETDETDETDASCSETSYACTTTSSERETFESEESIRKRKSSDIWSAECKKIKGNDSVTFMLKDDPFLESVDTFQETVKGIAATPKKGGDSTKDERSKKSLTSVSTNSSSNEFRKENLNDISPKARQMLIAEVTLLLEKMKTLKSQLSPNDCPDLMDDSRQSDLWREPCSSLVERMALLRERVLELESRKEISSFESSDSSDQNDNVTPNSKLSKTTTNASTSTVSLDAESKCTTTAACTNSVQVHRESLLISNEVVGEHPTAAYRETPQKSETKIIPVDGNPPKNSAATIWRPSGMTAAAIPLVPYVMPSNIRIIGKNRVSIYGIPEIFNPPTILQQEPTIPQLRTKLKDLRIHLGRNKPEPLESGSLSKDASAVKREEETSALKNRIAELEKLDRELEDLSERCILIGQKQQGFRAIYYDASSNVGVSLRKNPLVAGVFRDRTKNVSKHFSEGKTGDVAKSIVKNVKEIQTLPVAIWRDLRSQIERMLEEDAQT